MLPEAAHQWDRLSEEYTFWRETEFDQRLVRSVLGKCPESCRVAVDAGCGSGIHAVELATRGAGFVVAFDISWGMLLLARRRKTANRAANLALLAADAEVPPLRPGCGDFIISINALNGTDLRKSLPALIALLAPRGRLMIQLLVVRFAPLSALVALPTAYSLRTIAAAAQRQGLAAAWRVARFVLSPSWLRAAKGARPTLTALAQLLRELQPDVRLGPVKRGFATISWSAPGRAR